MKKKTPPPSQKFNVGQVLKKAGVKKREKREQPLWDGPCLDTPQGGITQSLLNDFLSCPERFRIKTIEGLQVFDRFKPAIEYGNLWHTCEEYYARKADWKEPLKQAAQELVKRYPLQQEEVVKFYMACLTQFPEYVKYWKGHEQEKKRKPIAQEVSFSVPYELPGRVATVFLRGKWDQIDIIDGKLWLKENKTKGNPNELAIQKQLKFDLQTMLYLVAMRETYKEPIAGVRYNVIRRPFSGGKGSIKRKEPTKTNPQGETEKEYYERLGAYFKEEPAEWFMRWETQINAKQIQRYEKEFLIPTLLRLTDWYDSVSECFLRGKSPFEDMNGIHYRTPYGVYNPVSEAGFTDLDAYLDEGSEVGLVRCETLFPEL
mgnify:CR=1 FL=1